VASVDQYGLEDIVYFAGHVHPPERALKACDVLIKLGRENVPWGRDMIEALSHGLPIVTLGTFQGFVENAVNGFIDPEFDAERVADRILKLRNEPALLATMRERNLEKSNKMFSPRVGALAIQKIYTGIVS
jgi:glycosyltransferase involved in cell wall biosynthesis